MILPIKKVPNFPIILIENFFHIDGKYLIPSIEHQLYKLDSNFGCNYPLDQDKFFKNLYSKLVEYSKLIFGNFHFSEKNTSQTFCYFSTENFYNEIWHSHKETSTINSVYYLSMPEKGGTIQFKYLNQIIDYLPNENDILIFPNFLEHRPMKPIGNKPRISINMEIQSCESSKKLFQRYLM